MAHTCTVRSNTGHHCSAAHRSTVENYRAARERAELEREAITYGYAADNDLYHALGAKPLITFKEWLMSTAREEY